MKTFFIAAIAIIVIVTATFFVVSTGNPSSEFQENQAIAELFQNANVTGTFVLYDVTQQTTTGYNQARAEQRFIPASTFKIPNSLIGLSTSTVKDADEILPYGGRPQPIEAWQQDMSLRDAIKISNVPVYQELARRIGHERMNENLSRIDYGNNQIGTVIDQFWLTGPLKISATEQTRFLARLAQNQLPFPADTQETVREMIVFETTPNWTLYAKTGWTGLLDDQPGVGWWVGWLQKNNQLYTFALNLEIQDTTDPAIRLKIGKAALTILGIIDPQ